MEIDQPQPVYQQIAKLPTSIKTVLL
jgi:hypothetical protein